MSYMTVIRLIKSLRKNYDEPVMCWKGVIEGRGISTVHEPSGDESSGDEESVSIGFDELSDCLVTPQHYTLKGDNIDKNVSPSNMTIECQTKSLYYFHSYAALNCVHFTGLSEETSNSRLLRNVEISFLPSIADCKAIRDNYIVLFARVIYKTLSAFSPFQKCVPQHNMHEFSTEMPRKTVTVSNITSTLVFYCIFVCIISGSLGCIIEK